MVILATQEWIIDGYPNVGCSSTRMEGKDSDSGPPSFFCVVKKISKKGQPKTIDDEDHTNPISLAYTLCN
jgi:hypothetical protein